MEIKQEKPIVKDHIDVLDGFRALSVLFVMCFHFWQQSWLGGIELPFLKETPLYSLPPREFFASGSFFVDVMLLLSAFVLFLPYARQMCDKTYTPASPLRFYVKRIARIVPSVYFHMLILQVFFLRFADYGGSAASYFKDAANNWLFAQNAPIFKNVPSLYTGTLWTLTVEMTLYLIFPLLARCFQKQPGLTFIGMVTASEAYIRLYAEKEIVEMGNTLPHRQFPAYLGVFAVGMLGALLYVQWSNNDFFKKKWAPWICTLLALGGIFLTVKFVWYGMGRADPIALWQVQYRLMMAGITVLTMLFTCFSVKGFRYIFANPVAKFMAGISFNLYIWHQFFSIRMKEWRIPYYPDECNGFPQGGGFEGYEAWQWKYMILLWAFSIAAAILTTYLIEKPCAKLILKLPTDKWENKIKSLFKKH